MYIMASEKRRVFFSFHYERDAWRAAQIRNMGIVEGNEPFSDNDWEEVKRRGDAAIERWIREQMERRTCCIVLIGTETACRKWVLREIEIAWELGLGVFGIYIHNLEDENGKQATMGIDPFWKMEWVSDDGKQTQWLPLIVCAHDPPCQASRRVYGYIRDHITGWIEDAIRIREQKGGYVRRKA